jgi:hypothetical protein
MRNDLLERAKVLIQGMNGLIPHESYSQWLADAAAPRANELSASEALYGFCGWLTSRREVTCMSERHDAACIAELIKRFCEVNRLSEPRTAWEGLLSQQQLDAAPQAIPKGEPQLCCACMGDGHEANCHLSTEPKPPQAMSEEYRKERQRMQEFHDSQEGGSPFWAAQMKALDVHYCGEAVEAIIQRHGLHDEATVELALREAFRAGRESQSKPLPPLTAEEFQAAMDKHFEDQQKEAPDA